MESISSNFIKRRSNFHGLILKGMTEFSGTDMRADSSYLTSAPYFAGKYHISLSTFENNTTILYQYFQKMVPIW